MIFLAALPAIIKVQTLSELKPYIHRLNFVAENDPLYICDEESIVKRKTESFSDDAFSTLIFEGNFTIFKYRHVFYEAAVFTNLKVVKTKTRFIFNHVPSQV